MTRPVSSPTVAAAALGVGQPSYLIEIAWQTQTSRLCTYGDLTWNGYAWSGEGVSISAFEPSGRPSAVTLVDPFAVYRTMVVATGIRDRLIKVWKCYVDALATADPVMLFKGYADRASIDGGGVTITLDWNANRRQFTPRERIGPSLGVNFVAPPGTRVRWGNQTFVIDARG
jgi:hypothetical protein